jgi:N-acetylglucosaminyldiphosphoundecaprenol N-acetyl-beta-D-mannosaminyltransferase
MQKKYSSFYLREIQILDIGRSELLSNLVEIVRLKEKFFAFALHIQALAFIRNKGYLKSFTLPNITYVDGVSITWILKIKRFFLKVRRYPTTNLGHDLIRELQYRLDNECRIALIGGPGSLAVDAMSRLEEEHGCKGVYANSGFHEDWGGVLKDLRSSAPDILFLGMGCPIENIWCLDHHLELPDCLVVTCGGWFGFLVGEERRSPITWQKFGFEWLWRLLLNPKRLTTRYLGGMYRLVYFILFQRKDINFRELE